MRRAPHFRPTLIAAALAWLSAGPAAALTIGDLQGTTHLSPFAGSTVSDILGIVTGVDVNGFWMQDAGDGNPLTSDGIYVFRGSSGSKPVAGDAVRVKGTVLEFRPGSNADNLTTTEISATGAAGGWTRISAGNALPDAFVIGSGFLPPTAIAPNAGNVETSGHVLQPTRYAMDFYESLEGMRVALPSAVAVAPRNTFGEVAVVASAQLGAAGTITSPRGGVVVGPGQFNGQRIQLDDRLVATPVVNGGAQLANIVGVLDYSFSNYKLYATQAVTVVSDSLAREAATIAPGRLGIASYNVQNLGGDASAARISAVAGQLKDTLGAPHIVALQEIQDSNGARNDGTVSAAVTLDRLTTELNAQTGRRYGYVTVNPVNNADGGQPGGNIRQAFLYDTARVSFAGGVGGPLDAIAAVADGNGRIALSLGAGRIDPTNPAFASSRKPLVTEFTVDGQQIIVVANHFNSKGGDQPLFGPNQPPVLSSEAQRIEQARVVGSFVRSLLAIDAHANIVVTGDFNDFQFADTLRPLTEAGLVDLTTRLPAGERYTYDFEGNLQALDHMFVSANLLSRGDWTYDIVHANAEFVDQVSDHDPLLFTLGAVPAPVPEPGMLVLLGVGLAVVGGAVRARR